MQGKIFRQVSFLTSAASAKQMPQDDGYEVAFMGRSNVGKSSSLNALVDNKRLARTSKTPGRTQLLNVFSLDDQRRLVDLPGFGYAKVSASVKNNWQQEIDTYLRTRKCLKGIILVMDIRHLTQDFEAHMVDWASQMEMPLHILLNKADKLTRNKARIALMGFQKGLEPYGDKITAQIFSAEHREGLSELHAVLYRWFSIDLAS